MTEINNKIPNFGFNVDKIEKSAKKNSVNEEVKNENKETPKYVQDTGVLGRSQLIGKGGDIKRSVDEAVYLAENHPDILNGSDDMFEKIHQDLIAKGVDEETAYNTALLGEEEFLDVANAHRK